MFSKTLTKCVTWLICARCEDDQKSLKANLHFEMWKEQVMNLLCIPGGGVKANQPEWSIVGKTVMCSKGFQLSDK